MDTSTYSDTYHIHTERSTVVELPQTVTSSTLFLLPFFFFSQAHLYFWIRRLNLKMLDLPFLKNYP